MATRTVLPDAVLDAFEGMAREVEAEKFTGWEPEQLKEAASLCLELRKQAGKARSALEELLSNGVERRWFLERFDPLAARLERLRDGVGRLLARPQARPVPESVGNFLIDFTALGKELVSIADLLAEPLATAKAPLPLIDRDRFAQVEAAYARGETKPFQGLKPGGEG
jgi:hypothetical protein